MVKKCLVLIFSFVLSLNVLCLASGISDTKKQYIIILETPPIAEKSIGEASLMTVGDVVVEKSEENIAKEQQMIIDKIDNLNSCEITVVEQLDTVLNCIIIESEELDIEKIAELSGVKEVFEDQPILMTPIEYDLKSTYSASETAVSAPYAVDGIKGEEMLIAIIDDGFDALHKAFAISEGTEVRLSEDKANSLIEENNLTGNYLNKKIPYYKESLTPTKKHGTHVAGIVGGNNEEIQGAAPEAQLILIEAADKNGEIFLGPVVAGINDAVKMGADCINISLGNATSFPDLPTETNLKSAIRNANNMGIIVCHAAGNDGREMRNGIYELIDEGATRKNNILFAKNPDYKRSAEYATDVEVTVGSLEASKLKYSSLEIENCNSYVPIFSSNIFSDWEMTEKVNSLVRRPEGLNIVNCGNGTGTFPAAVSGHIALIDRVALPQPVYSFKQLAENAFEAGAVGVIFSNDLPTTHTGYKNVFPVNVAPPFPKNTFITGTAAYITDYMINSMGENGILKLKNAKNIYNNMASLFTSWGVSNDLKLVPSVSAYGTGIYSSIPNNQYATMNGTSMSTPYITACTALIKQGLKENNYSATELNRIVKNLLMSTAELTRQPETGDADTSGVYLSPRQVGLGNANPQKALDAQCLILGSSQLPKIDLGELDNKRITFSLSLENITEFDAIYEVSCETMTDNYGELPGVPEYVIKDEMIRLSNVFTLEEGENVTNNIVTVPANKTISISGVIELDEEELNEFADIFENGFFIDGILNFTAQDTENGTGADIHCALMGFYGDWNNPPTIDPYAGEKGSYYYQTSLYRSNGFPAGVNMADVDGEIDTDKLCVGDVFTFSYVPLRNIQSVITKIDQKTISNVTYQRFKNHKYNEYGPIAVGVSGDEMKGLAEGEHVLNLATRVTRDRRYSNFSVPFITDLTLPTIDATYISDGDELNIDVTVSDNFYLQYLEIDEEKYILNSDKGEEMTIRVNADKDNEIVVNVYDYADNMSSVTISTVIEDENGNIYHSLKEAVEAVGIGNTTLNVVNYCEELKETVVIPENKNITITGSAKFTKNEMLALPAVKVLGNLKIDTDVIGLEVSVIPEIVRISYENGEISAVLTAPASNPFASVFVASYDENGMLIDFVTLQGDTVTPTAKIKGGNYYTAFVWDSLCFMPYRSIEPLKGK